MSDHVSGPPPAPARTRAARPGPPRPARPGDGSSGDHRGRRADGVTGPPKGQGLSRIVLDAVTQGSPAVVTALAIFTALVVGGLLNAFTTPTVLHAWGNFFSAPGHAIAAAWEPAPGAYVAMFEGSIFNPHTVAALFQQASFGTAIHDGYLSAVFNPLSETCVQATPLILAGLAVALPYQAGLFNIGAAEPVHRRHDRRHLPRLRRSACRWSCTSWSA